MIECHKVVSVVVQPVLAIFMSMEARVENRPTPAAGCGACKSIIEDGTPASERVYVGRLYVLLAVTAERAAKVVGYNQEDVLVCRHVDNTNQTLRDTARLLSFPLGPLLSYGHEPVGLRRKCAERLCTGA